MPANHKMTFVCFDIAKVQCQMLNIIEYFFSNFYMPMHDLLKKNMQRKIKSKKIKMLLNMIASVYCSRCGSYRIYLEGDSPHQIVMIVCELKWFSHISNRHNMYTLMQFCDVFHSQHAIFFATLDTCVGVKMYSPLDRGFYMESPLI